MDQTNCGLPLCNFEPRPESEEGLPGLPEAAGEPEAVLRGASRCFAVLFGI